MSRPRGLAVGLLLLFVAALASASASTGASSLRIAVALDNGTAFAGFEADFAAELCARMAAACEFVPVGNGIRPLLSHKVDAVIAGMTVRTELRAVVDFTRAYAEPTHGIVARVDGPLADLPDSSKTISLATTPAEGAAAIAALRQAVTGRTIGAAPDSPAMAFLERYFGEGTRIVATTQPADDLVQGRLDLVMEALPARNILTDQPSASGLTIVGPRFRDDDSLGFGIAVGVRKSDRALHDRLDRAIADMIADGSLRQLSISAPTSARNNAPASRFERQPARHLHLSGAGGGDAFLKILGGGVVRERCRRHGYARELNRDVFIIDKLTLLI